MRNRFWQWRVVAALVMALLVAPSPAGVSAATPTIAYRFAESVSAADEAYVREGISMAAAYLDEALRGEIRDDLTVRVRNTEHPENAYILASAGDDELVVYTGSEMWETLSPVLRMQVVIHEYVHIYQRDMLGNGYDVSPMWFIEGMAEYVSFNALEEWGLIESEAVDDFQTWAIAHGGDMPPLAEIEDLERFQSSEGPVYSLSHMAMVLLLGDEPEARLETYLDDIDDGAEWRDAFPDAFDVELDDFYDAFDAWLDDEMDAPSRIPTAFREVVGRDREASVTILSGPDEPLERGDQAVVVAETERDSNCRFDLRDEDGERVASLRTVADRTGLVFWVITIPDDAPFGRTEIIANCGGDRDRLRFEVLAG